MAKEPAERNSIGRNRNALWISCIGRVFCSEPGSTSPENASMIVLFAFLHHVAAFTLVAAVALEFVLS